MARSEKILLALASLFFAGTIYFGFFGALKAQFRYLAVKDAETKLHVAWLKRRHQMCLLAPESLPEFRRTLVPGTQAPFAVNRNLIGTIPEDFTRSDQIVAIYEPLCQNFHHGLRAVVYLDGHYKQLSPEKWEKARRDSGIIESPPALRPWWKFWQSGPREFFPREAFAAVYAELWLSFCVLNAISYGRWAGGLRGFGRFWFSLTASFVIGIGLAILASTIFRV